MVCFWVPPNLFMVNFECFVYFFRCSYIFQLDITNWLTFAFKTLLTKSKQDRTTVIAPYQFIVRVDNKTMCHIYFDYTIILRIRNIKNLKKVEKKTKKDTHIILLFLSLLLRDTYSRWHHGIACEPRKYKFGIGNPVYQGPKWIHCNVNRKQAVRNR